MKLLAMHIRQSYNIETDEAKLRLIVARHGQPLVNELFVDGEDIEETVRKLRRMARNLLKEKT